MFDEMKSPKGEMKKMFGETKSPKGEMKKMFGEMKSPKGEMEKMFKVSFRHFDFRVGNRSGRGGDR